MGIAREMGRLIRLSYNGHITISELTGYMYALDKTRACLESALNLEAEAAAKAPPPPSNMHVSIVAVPSGVFVNDEMMQRLHENVDSFPRRPLIEHVMEPAAETVRSELAAGPIEHAQAEPEASAIAPEAPTELDPLRRRARELGFELLPPRPARVD